MSDIVKTLRYWALPPAGETREPENATLLKWAADEIERLRQQVTQRGARMQTMREWMRSGYELMGPQAWPVWDAFVDDRPEAAEWFDGNGVPR